MERLISSLGISISCHSSSMRIVITITNMEDIIHYLESSYDNYEVPGSTELRNELSKYMRESLSGSDLSPLVDRRIVSVTSGKKPIKYHEHNPLSLSY